MWLILSDKKLGSCLIKELMLVGPLLLHKVKIKRKLLNKNKIIIIINKMINLYINKILIMLLKIYKDVNWVRILFMIHIMLLN